MLHPCSWPRNGGHTFSLPELSPRPTSLDPKALTRRAPQQYHYELLEIPYSLPLLEAIVLETHRLTPSISGPLPRVTPPGGCELAGFFIPGGVRVSGQAYSLHKEEQLFGGHASAWRPDRWLEAGEKWEKR